MDTSIAEKNAESRDKVRATPIVAHFRPKTSKTACQVKQSPDKTDPIPTPECGSVRKIHTGKNARRTSSKKMAEVVVVDSDSEHQEKIEEIRLDEEDYVLTFWEEKASTHEDDMEALEGKPQTDPSSVETYMETSIDEKDSHTRTTVKWSGEETHALLDILLDMLNRQNRVLTLNGFREASLELKKRGFRKSPQECRLKLNRLKRTYGTYHKRKKTTAALWEFRPKVETIVRKLNGPMMSSRVAKGPEKISKPHSDRVPQLNPLEMREKEQGECTDGSNSGAQDGKFRWRDKSVTHLLRLYSSKADQLCDGNLPPSAWEDIARMMTLSGLRVSASQCSSKVDRLKNTHKEMARRRTIQPLSLPEQVVFDQLNAVFPPIVLDGSLENTSSTLTNSDAPAVNTAGPSAKTAATPLNTAATPVNSAVARAVEIKGDTFEEQIKSYLAKTLARQEENERARRLRHQEQMEMKRKLMEAFSELLKRC